MSLITNAKTVVSVGMKKKMSKELLMHKSDMTTRGRVRDMGPAMGRRHTSNNLRNAVDEGRQGTTGGEVVIGEIWGLAAEKEKDLEDEEPA